MTPPIQRIRDVLAPNYSVDRELGRGGMATVYLAQDSKHDRVVALKVLHPELAASLGPDRFLREIRVAARLNHPHILPLFDSGEIEGLLYYVMPYVEGESLRERLDRQHQLPIEEAIHHARGIASALDYAHRQNVVHRDIKPENVMLYEGEPMVMDFGIAKALSAADGQTQMLTQTGMMVGTPAYVSPEQAAGETQLDGRSDQYSLACVLYEMLSGQRPFTGATAQAILAKRFTDTPRQVRQLRADVPESVERALNKAMSTDISDRYRTSALFGQALRSSSLDTPTNTQTMPLPTVSAAKSVAVLPFANMSADPDNEYFTDGMAEEIINALTKIQMLRVASRTSSFAFKGKNEDIGEIGHKLKVSTILEGSVRKMGNKLRITAQLVNVADGYHLWSERYDRELEDVFAIQDDISQAIVKALRVILTEGEKKAIEKPRMVNVQAYDFYLRGRQYFQQWRRRGVEHARRMFERAIEIDPSFARAYAGIADCCSFMFTYWDASATNLERSESASRQALALDPELPEAYVSRGWALAYNKGHAESSEEAFRQAIRLDPKLFEAHYVFASTLLQQGRNEEAAQEFIEASRLRPDDYQAPCFHAQALSALGRSADALVMVHRAIELLKRHLELNPDDPRALSLGGSLMTQSDDPAERSQGLEFANRTLAADPEDSATLYNLACLYAKLGESEQALSIMEKAVHFGFGHKDWIINDPDLNSLRKEPRFEKLVALL
jgi:serine/threonine protein kinase/tetratricopeptide (TPR) repeat protein